MTDLVPADLAAPGTPAEPDEIVADPSLQALVEASGLTRIHLLAWRDLADPEAGGSEVHADKVAQAWAQAGLDVTMRTAAAAGPARVRQAQRLLGRPQGRSLHASSRAPRCPGAIGRTGPRDGLVEIWNGMPFFSPVWARCPKIVFLHHVHAEMWRMVLPPKLAKLGETIEFKAAPPFYRSSQIVTLSQLQPRRDHRAAGHAGANVTVVPPGIDPMYQPGGARSPHPLVVAVGRLVPVKRPGRAGRRAAGDQAGQCPRSKPCWSARATSGRRWRRRSGRPARRIGYACPAGSATPNWSGSTSAPGCSPRPRRAKAGA